jgi:hypothetical protein
MDKSLIGFDQYFDIICCSTLFNLNFLNFSFEILLSKIILIEVFNGLQSYDVFDKNILNSILFVRIVRKLFSDEEIELN